MELFRNANFDFLGKKWPFIIVSLVLIAAGVISLVVKGGPRYGIDLRGGALVYVKFAERPPINELRSALSQRLPGGTPEIQEVTGTNEVIIGTEMREERELEQARQMIIDTLAARYGQNQAGKVDLNNATEQDLVELLRSGLAAAGKGMGEDDLRQVAERITDFRDTPPRSGLFSRVDQVSQVEGVTPDVLQVLQQQTYVAPYAIRGVEVVGPKVGRELQEQAVYVVLAALAGMLIYIALRFEWIYGVAAVAAVAHDAFVTVGFFSMFDKEISLTVVAALLTLIGYSMNDTIVIFDRIRENLGATKRMSYSELVNASINQTLGRTIMTSGLTFLTVLSLWLFGGPVLNGFSFALVVGIIVGTYSTVFIASPILVFWRNRAERGKKTPASATSSVASGRKTPAKAVK
jgi:preprotein translocase subunit SecF